MSTLSISQAIPLLTEPLVSAGFYPTSEQALKQIILDYVDRRITWVQIRIRRLEKKHGQSFADYSQSLSRSAGTADEDEWMEWESLIDMLESWRHVKSEVQHSDAG